MEIGWTDVGSGGYILVSRAHSNTSCYQYVFMQYAANVLNDFMFINEDVKGVFPENRTDKSISCITHIYDVKFFI